MVGLIRGLFMRNSRGSIVPGDEVPFKNADNKISRPGHRSSRRQSGLLSTASGVRQITAICQINGVINLTQIPGSTSRRIVPRIMQS